MVRIYTAEGFDWLTNPNQEVPAGHVGQDQGHHPDPDQGHAPVLVPGLGLTHVLAVGHVQGVEVTARRGDQSQSHLDLIPDLALVPIDQNQDQGLDHVPDQGHVVQHQRKVNPGVDQSLQIVTPSLMTRNKRN